MSFFEQPIDHQVNILRRLSIPSLLQACRTTRQFRNLCQTQLDPYFQQLTQETFGITTLIKENWYLTFLTVYNDLIKIVNMLLTLIPINPNHKKYLNINPIVADLEILLMKLLKDVNNHPTKYFDMHDDVLVYRGKFASRFEEILQIITIIDVNTFVYDEIELLIHYDDDVRDIIDNFFKKYVPSLNDVNTFIL